MIFTPDCGPDTALFGALSGAIIVPSCWTSETSLVASDRGGDGFGHLGGADFAGA
jgi:hypothetical protein